MSVQRADLEIIQGATEGYTFTISLDGGVFDLTGYEARLQAREKLYEDPVLDLVSTGASPNLTITAGSGLVVMLLTAAQTALLDFNIADYNLEVYQPLTPFQVYRVLQGVVSLSKDTNR